MTWTKAGDDYPDRLLELSDAAYRLHHAATVYANRVGLDGRIPKTRLTLVPVPQRTRRPAIVLELVNAGHWRDEGDAWTLVDFFEAQLSAEEVAATRNYDAIRQRIRYAKTPETKAELKAQEDEAKRALFDARERRRARASQRETHRDSHRPVPLRPVPTRPAPSEGEVEDERGPGGALGGARLGPTNEECAECHLRLNHSRDRIRAKEMRFVDASLDEPQGSVLVYVHDSWSECVDADVRLNGRRTVTATGDLPVEADYPASAYEVGA